jgi:ankyrin repeat protein
MKLLFLVAASAFAAISLSWGDPASDALLAAARASDAEKLVLALAEASPDARDSHSQTALMLAAKAGSFECAKRLLWSGADARLKDDSGKIALDFLDPTSSAYAPLSLLLRCHAFCRE